MPSVQQRNNPDVMNQMRQAAASHQHAMSTNSALPNKLSSQAAQMNQSYQMTDLERAAAAGRPHAPNQMTSAFEPVELDVESEQSEFNSSNTSSVIVPGDFPNQAQRPSAM